MFSNASVPQRRLEGMSDGRRNTSIASYEKKGHDYLTSENDLKNWTKLKTLSYIRGDKLSNHFEDRLEAHLLISQPL